MSLIKLIDLKTLGDERGQLVVIEGNKNIPFEIKRVYYLTETKKNVSRGFHAHKKLHQIAVCLSGKCRVVLDNGFCREEAWLDKPDVALEIDEMIWHELHDFSEDCVVLLLANEIYNEADYIRDYNEYLSWLKK